MDPNSLLETHAQLALTLAGFASVVGALTKPLTAVQRSRFLILLSLALRQVLGCVIPIWLFTFIAVPSLIWQLSSILGLVLFAWHMIWVVFLPVRKLGPAPIILNPPISLLLPMLSAATGLAFLMNSLGVLIEPSFAVYYFALVTSLVSGFLLFADALVGQQAVNSPPPNKRMQPTHQPVIKFAYANSPLPGGPLNSVVRRHGRDAGNSERREDRQTPSAYLRAVKVEAVAQCGRVVGFGGTELETES